MDWFARKVNLVYIHVLITDSHWISRETSFKKINPFAYRTFGVSKSQIRNGQTSTAAKYMFAKIATIPELLDTKTMTVSSAGCLSLM